MIHKDLQQVMQLCGEVGYEKNQKKTPQWVPNMQYIHDFIFALCSIIPYGRGSQVPV